jgi:hypothetical protein
MIKVTGIEIDRWTQMMPVIQNYLISIILSVIVYSIEIEPAEGFRSTDRSFYLLLALDKSKNKT